MEPSMTAAPTLVSFDLCPYVQRAAIALNEKGVSFKRIDVDLADKPGWFKKISPLGKVPLLKVGEEVLFESTVIVEYLEETQPNPLHPADPLARARHRAWMEFGSSILADIWVIETTPDVQAFRAKQAVLREKFARLEAQLGDGPFFAGARFSLVDAVFAPAFRYFEVFERIAPLGVFDGLSKVQAWRRALAARASVRTAVVPDYAERLFAWLREQPSYLASLMPTALAA
jgi:glutathione S-transferase